MHNKQTKTYSQNLVAKGIDVLVKVNGHACTNLSNSKDIPIYFIMFFINVFNSFIIKVNITITVIFPSLP